VPETAKTFMPRVSVNDEPVLESLFPLGSVMLPGPFVLVGIPFVMLMSGDRITSPDLSTIETERTLLFTLAFKVYPEPSVADHCPLV
jgi:hypothetical protein